jgi:homoserine kinase (EC 2.7.1.39)
MGKVSADERVLLQQVLAFQDNLDLDSLPRGVIHGDLFRDNVLFDGAALGGFIDFYYACHDVLAYDVAIAVNDWCLTESGGFDEPRLNSFMQSYTEVRPFNEGEKQAWQGLLCIAALRFWLSRLYDFHFPVEGELTQAKDPDYFKNILLKRATPSAL